MWNRERRENMRWIMEQFHLEIMSLWQNLFSWLSFYNEGATIWESLLRCIVYPVLRGVCPNPLWTREIWKKVRCIIDQFHHEMMAWGQNLICCSHFCIWGTTVWDHIQIGMVQIWCKYQKVWMLGTPRGAKHIHVTQLEEYHRHLRGDGSSSSPTTLPNYRIRTPCPCCCRMMFVRKDVMAWMRYKMGKGGGDWLGRGQKNSMHAIYGEDDRPSISLRQWSIVWTAPWVVNDVVLCGDDGECQRLRGWGPREGRGDWAVVWIFGDWLCHWFSTFETKMQPWGTLFSAPA